MKGGQLNKSLVTMITLVVALVVMLFVVPGFGNVIERAATTGSCQFNFALNAIIGIPPECEASYTTLSIVNLTKGVREAKRRIKQWNEKKTELENKRDKKKKQLTPTEEKVLNGYTNALSYFDPTKKDRTDPNSYYYEYAMDEYIARSMKSCWAKVHKGKLDIFDNPWHLIDLHFGEWGKNKGTLVGDKESQGLFIDTYGLPTFCVLCERINFDQSIKNTFRDKIVSPDPMIKSLTPWMDNNPVVPPGTIGGHGKLLPTDNTPYSEYLEDDVHKGLFRQEHKYTLTEPYAVLYLRVNVDGPTKWSEKGLNWLGWLSDEEVDKPVNVISIVPYKEIGERCHILIA